MNKKCFALAIVFSLFVSCIALADRTLDRTEILQIFEKLTSQPRKTWISAGVIEATHEEYRAPKTTDLNEINSQINKETQEYQRNLKKHKLTEELQKMKLDAIPFNVRYRLANEYTVTSMVVERLNGERRYCKINVDSRTDSVKPGRDLEGNFMTEEFNLNWNARRIFAWDGEKYTSYCLPINYAVVDVTGNTPHVVNGPLTAGVIPWGCDGDYHYDNLAAVDFSAVEKYIEGQTQIHLTLNSSNGCQMLLVMDPAKDYAVLSCSIMGPENLITSKQYSNYQLLSGNWVPTTVLIEQHDAGTNKLLAYDLWNFTEISSDAPAPDSFNVNFETDALVEYWSVVADKPLMYRYSPIVDTDLLLTERLAIAASEGVPPQNCATVAMEYVARQLGKEVTDQQLTQLMNESNGDTSLYEMTQFAQELGLYCRAVKTDIQTLKSLSGCQMILHIPVSNHFVVLERIDDRHMWIIDLANNKFFYRTDMDFCGMDWTEGTALLISDKPIQLQGNFSEMADAQLHNITGTAGYTCTRLLQQYNAEYCSYVGGECFGYYRVYYTRYGCEAAPSGSCTSSWMVRMKQSPCINHPYYPWHCTTTGNWTYYYMRACR